MNCLMAPGGPARPLHDARGVILRTNDDFAARGLRLEVTPQAKVLIARHEHFLVRGSMRVVAGSATFANRLVFENKWTPLRDVTLHAGFVLRHHRCSTALDCLAFVGVMTIRARDFPIFHWMMMGCLKAGLLIQMTLKTNFGVTSRVYDCVPCSAALGVSAPGPVARFTADFLRVRPFRFQPHVRGRGKMFSDILVALLTGFVSHKRRAFDVRRNDERPLNRGARDQRGCGRYRKQPEQYGAA
jgi:hypothetical protein